MFGSADRLEKQLRNGGGKTAVAHILEAKKGRFALSSGGDAAQQVASAHINWTLTLQVAPGGESPFDAVVKEAYPEMSAGPAVGSALGVLYDPKDHTKVVVDHSTAGTAARVAGNLSAASRAAFEQSGGASAEQLLQERITDPAAFQQRMQARAAATAPAPSDPADQIAKLADLRDRGALTEEEFQAQKKQVLGT